MEASALAPKILPSNILTCSWESPLVCLCRRRNFTAKCWVKLKKFDALSSAWVLPWAMMAFRSITLTRVRAVDIQTSDHFSSERAIGDCGWPETRPGKLRYEAKRSAFGVRSGVFGYINATSCSESVAPLNYAVVYGATHAERLRGNDLFLNACRSWQFNLLFLPINQACFKEPMNEPAGLLISRLQSLPKWPLGMRKNRPQLGLALVLPIILWQRKTVVLTISTHSSFYTIILEFGLQKSLPVQSITAPRCIFSHTRVRMELCWCARSIPT